MTMTSRHLLILASLILSATARADYALPQAEERVVLLLEAKKLTIDKERKTLSIAGVRRSFSIDRFWMQDRIWGDGICVGVKATDPKSSTFRVKEIARVLEAKKRAQVLVEMVRVKGTKSFIVTFLKTFDAKKEFPRYFPKRTFYDTVAIELPGAPENSEEFAEALEKVTASALKRLAVAAD